MMLACQSGESLTFVLLLLKSPEAKAGLWNDGGKCGIIMGSADLPALSYCVLITSVTRQSAV